MNIQRILFGTAARTILLGLATIAIIFLINSSKPTLIERAEFAAGDLRMSALSARPSTGLVAVVEIDDDSIAKLGRWPWPRGVMAQLINALNDYKVAVIGLDILFIEPDNIDRDHQALAARLGAAGVKGPAVAEALGPQNDVAFADAIAHQGSTWFAFPFGGVYLNTRSPTTMGNEFVRELREPRPLTYTALTRGRTPDLYGADSYLPPLPLIANSARGSAYVNVDHDLDGSVRAIPVVIRFNGDYYVPFAIALANAYRGGTPLLSIVHSTIHVKIGRAQVPADEIGRMLLDFRGGGATVPTFSAVDVIAHRVPPLSLKGKVVLVGLTGRGLGDRQTTPAKSDVPGVMVHATAVDEVLAGHFVKRSEVTVGESRLWAFLLGLAITIAMSRLSPAEGAATAVALGASYFGYAEYRLKADGAMLGVIFPLLTLVITASVLTAYRYATEGLRSRRLRRAFARYIPETIVDRLANEERDLVLGGEQRTITVIFADLTGFTAASTSMSPSALTAKINRYFDYVVQPIDASHGYVERFLGDAALAFWGAPVSDPDHAVHAVETAFKIIDGVRRAREVDEARGEPGFTIKVGINTGSAVVGNVGSQSRWSYTAIGEDVNLTSRIEGIPPVYGCLIAIGEETARTVKDKFLLRELDRILVKGESQAITVYEPIAPIAAATEAKSEMVAHYEKALACYRAMRFAEASAIWDEVVAKYESAPSPSSTMAARAREYAANPPPATWDGVYVMTTK